MLPKTIALGAHARQLSRVPQCVLLAILLCGLTSFGGCQTWTTASDVDQPVPLAITFSRTDNGRTQAVVKWEGQETPALLAVFISSPIPDDMPSGMSPRSLLGTPAATAELRGGVLMVRSVEFSSGADRFELDDVKLAEVYSVDQFDVDVMIVSRVLIDVRKDWSVKDSQITATHEIDASNCKSSLSLLDTTEPASRNVGVIASSNMIFESDPRGHLELFISTQQAASLRVAYRPIIN